MEIGLTLADHHEGETDGGLAAAAAAAATGGGREGRVDLAVVVIHGDRGGSVTRDAAPGSMAMAVVEAGRRISGKTSVPASSPNRLHATQSNFRGSGSSARSLMISLGLKDHSQVNTSLVVSVITKTKVVAAVDKGKGDDDGYGGRGRRTRVWTVGRTWASAAEDEDSGMEASNSNGYERGWRDGCEGQGRRPQARMAGRPRATTAVILDEDNDRGGHGCGCGMNVPCRAEDEDGGTKASNGCGREGRGRRL
uniref:DUF834 domain-containing protein n=1 Tax=Oryza barthii TaxID=65489 RepID=A0A0D3HDF0_9ORYZ